MDMKTNFFPMVEVLRGSYVESVHSGSAIVVGPKNEIIAEWGDTKKLIFPRSSMKMVQAIPFLESGAVQKYRLGFEQVALACASHQGSLRHTGIIKNWLSEIGSVESDLRCGIQPPSASFDREALRELGEKPTQINNNCSGKHAGFLTFNKYFNFDPEYNAVDHPLQRKIRDIFQELTNEEINKHGIDGCSAPNFMCSLKGLATAMTKLADPKILGLTRRNAVNLLLESMYTFPHLVAGTGRACTELMLAADCLTICKTGAEGVFVAVLPKKKLGIALKIADGSTRAAEASITAILVRLGVLNKDHPAVGKRLFSQIKNWNGSVVGQVRPTDKFWHNGKKLNF